VEPPGPRVVGPRTRYVAPERFRGAPPSYPATSIARLLDDRDPGAELYAALISIEREVPLHFHPVLEFQYVLIGSGVALDADGQETPIGPGGAVLSPAGPAGAHGFKNTGSLPLTMLCVFPAPGGVPPSRTAFVPDGGPLIGPR